MISDYVRTAVRRATDELMDGDEGFFGRISECRGVRANEPTLEACRDELQSLPDDWLLIGLGTTTPFS